MDSFPVKRGIGLSRIPNPVSYVPFKPAHVGQEHIPRTMQPQITINRPTQNAELSQARNQVGHSRTFSIGAPANYQEKVFPPEAAFREIAFRNQGSVQLQPPPNNPIKFAPIMTIIPQQQERQVANEQLQTQVNQLASEDKKMPADLSPTTPIGPIIQIQPKSPTRTKTNAIRDERSFQIPQILQKSAIENIEIRAPPSPDKIDNSKLKIVMKEKDDLAEELKKFQQVNDSLLQEKAALLKQIQENANSIEKQRQVEEELKAKVTALEQELRMMKGNKNRLEIEIDSSKKLFKSERDKNEKAREQMNKLIFFEDDLIHAKDYNRLKDEVEYVLSENKKLYQEHQQYINEVGQYKKTAENNLNELRMQLKQLRDEYGQYRSLIESLMNAGEDKVALLKLQTEVNFLRKKSEEQTEQLCTKGRELQQAMEQVKKMASKLKEGSSFLDEISLWQIKDTVALYETRMTDLTSTLNKTQSEAEKQKKTIQLLTSELRKTREDRNISSMKEKCSENNLKNEVEMLQMGHQTELQLKNKRISNLEESVQRKSKEIANKDKFIKDFLIARVKQLDTSSLDGLLLAIKQYFEPTETTPEQAELTPEQAEHSPVISE